jgi:hypothetical protein
MSEVDELVALVDELCCVFLAVPEADELVESVFWFGFDFSAVSGEVVDELRVGLCGFGGFGLLVLLVAARLEEVDMDSVEQLVETLFLVELSDFLIDQLEESCDVVV